MKQKNYSENKILILGGSGYLGSFLVNQFKNKNIKINYPRKSALNLLKLKEKLDYDIIFHCAEYCDSRWIMKHPFRVFFNSVISTINLIRKSGKGSRIFYFSSYAVENMSFSRHFLYDFSKYINEKLYKIFRKNSVVVRIPYILRKDKIKTESIFFKVFLKNFKENNKVIPVLLLNTEFFNKILKLETRFYRYEDLVENIKLSDLRSWVRGNING